jgi:trigger factor
MAENEPNAAVAEEPEFKYTIRVEDAGPATKRIFVDIPPERIADKLANQFKELRAEAHIPGFRPGHAPQKLVEKRFHADVREQVRRSLVSESYEQAIKSNSLNVLGEPEFQDAEKIQLPEAGPLSYSFLVEVQPQIKLPELKGLKVTRPKIAVNDENVEQALLNLRQQQGTLIPVENRGVEAGDYIVADVHVRLDQTVVGHQHDVQMVVKPSRISGIPVDDFATQLAGLKAGETRSVKAKAPDDHANEVLRGKFVDIDVAVKDLKRLELVELNKEFLEDMGFTSEAELRSALKNEMEERIKSDIQQSMRDQVSKYLLDSVPIELPTKLSDRQTDRVVGRRSVALMMRGMSQDQVQADTEALRTGAKEEAVRELKLFFILQQVAAEQKVEVSEGELNGRVASMAIPNGQRPEKLKQEMAKDGSLSNLYIQMREQKALDKILETAQVEEVEVKPEAAA